MVALFRAASLHAFNIKGKGIQYRRNKTPEEISIT
jgi:hypothetical protein